MTVLHTAVAAAADVSSNPRVSSGATEKRKQLKRPDHSAVGNVYKKLCTGLKYISSVPTFPIHHS